ncbi:MAG: hypothetical protein LC785_13790 [Acidobacteria bacterium]|nr:hypothetical protein [Acidobacteriota bacterium]
MYLIQLLLPLYDNEGEPFGRDHFDGVRNELASEFGGVTAFRRSPAEGVWVQTAGEVSRDEVVIFEVMADRLERRWWSRYRRELEERFRQDRLVIRATEWEQL